MIFRHFGYWRSYDGQAKLGALYDVLQICITLKVNVIERSVRVE